ncbi:hypothetical protein [Flavobacterium sp.]|uniref:hypothetical protein n=1 Tax=Flavobacterium sp. TaxID=239 RepID=UPI00121C54B5|nr:hypothetical protein [Flavobacterium sp.]RZJ72727.1 MAG: hypothetical protein EOO49_03560 [Flavobacterium sp.]
MSVPSSAKISTFLFRIPHISNLLCFNDALCDKDSLISVVSQILKLGDPEILYKGYDPVFSPRKEVMSKIKDSAIVRVCIPGKEIIRRDPAKTVRLVVDELQKPRNVISVASDTLSPYSNIIAVAISVESARHKSRFHVECAPIQQSA